MIAIEKIINELKYCYTQEELITFLGSDIETAKENIIRNFFNEHCEKNKVPIKMGEMFKTMTYTDFVVSTPDGYQEIGDFYLKGPDYFYVISTYGGFKTKCIGSHMFETHEGWKYASELTKDDELLTVDGYIKIKSIKKTSEVGPAYDFEVKHDNHRYWSGNGLSSHNTGKSFLAISMCKSAQKKGYTPIYMDSEAAIDKEFVERLGCDSSKFIIKQVTKISEVSHFIANLCQKLLAMKEEERPKFILVLDSLGNLTSDKELTDTIDGNQKRDMTKQQEIKALFRTNTTALGKLGIPFIVNSHIYQTQDLFSKQIVAGGSGVSYNSSLTIMLSTAKLDDKESDKVAASKVGDFLKTGVIVTARPEKSRFTIPQRVKFQIPFFKPLNPYVGLEAYLTWENSGILRGKMLTEKEYMKLSPAEQGKCHEMTDESGNLTYAYPKDSSKNIVVKHLYGEVPLTELFTSKVLTDELLHKLDDEVIRPNFELPSQDKLADIDELSEIIDI